MKLILKKFRCHSDKSIELEDNGVTLIHGNSGVGKSTIFEALYYALYGKVKKPYTFGGKSCSVELIYKDLNITRKSGPSSLTLKYMDEEYNDEGAQSVINNYIGANTTQFHISSYFDQSKHSSILSMTPSEQLKLIEDISFSDDSHINTKEKVKKHIDDIKEKIHENDIEIKTLEKTINMNSEKVDVTNLDVNNKKYNERKVNEKTKEIVTRLEKIKKELEKVKKSYKKFEKFENEQKVNTKKAEKIEAEIGQLKELLSDTEKLLEKTGDLETLENESEELKILLDNIENFERIVEYREEIKEVVVNMNEKVNEKSKLNLKQLKKHKKIIERYEKELEMKEKNRLYQEKLDGFVKKQNKLVKNIKKIVKCKSKSEENIIESLKQKIEDEILTIEELKTKLSPTYTCPKCKQCIKIVDGIAKKTKKVNNDEDDEDIQEEIDGSEGKKNIFLESLAEYEESVHEINDLAAYLYTGDNGFLSEDVYQDSLKKVQDHDEFIKQNDVKKDVNKNSITNINKKISKIEKSLKKLTEFDNHKISSNSKNQKTIQLHKVDYEYLLENKDLVEDKYNKIKDRITNIQRCKGEISKLNRQIKEKEKTIEGFGKKFLERNKDEGDELKEKIGEMEDERDELLGEQQNHFSIVENMKKIKIYKENERKIKEMKDKVKKLIKDNEKLNERLENSKTVLSTADNAVLVSMLKTVDSINEHAKIYLDKMFEEEGSILASICIKEQNKQGGMLVKPKLSTQIIYKGYDYDDINDLSGGERQRCDLAFLLALNDIFGSKILLLDECLNNLDENTNKETLEFVKEFCKEKACLVISHEAINGVFDHILKVQ